MKKEKSSQAKASNEENANQQQNDTFNTASGNAGNKEDNDALFTDDNNRLQTKEEHDEDKSNQPGNDEKATPLTWDDTPTLGDKITVNPENEDIVTLVNDNDSETDTLGDDEAH